MITTKLTQKLLKSFILISVIITLVGCSGSDDDLPSQTFLGELDGTTWTRRSEERRVG